MPTSFRICSVIAMAAAAQISNPAMVGAQSLLPGWSWSGPHWGLDAGAAWSNAREVRKAAELNWGAHAGYGLHVGPIYLGVEGDATWGGAHASSVISPIYSSTLEVDWTATARARAGLVVGPALAYVTGGAAWSGQSVTLHALGSKLSSTSTISAGTVVGAGLEVKPLPFIAVRLEGLRYDFSSDVGNSLKSLPAGVTSNALKGLTGDETVVRAGVSLRFN